MVIIFSRPRRLGALEKTNIILFRGEFGSIHGIDVNILAMKWAGVGVVLVGMFLGHFWLVGQAVYGDGRYYWAAARSMWIDHDLYLKNELRHHYSPVSNNTFFENIGGPVSLGGKRSDH